MKVLWVCTSPVGPMAKALDETYQGASGGWIGAEYDNLNDSSVEVAFLTMKRSVGNGEILRKEYNGSRMYYIGAPRLSFGIDPPDWMKTSVDTVIDEFSPDLIQIWGTESVLGYVAATAETAVKKLIFLQGIIGIYIRYKSISLAGEDRIPLKQQLSDKLKNKLYQKQAELEKQALKQVQGVILDNDFSEGYCKSVNPSLCVIRYPLLPQKAYYQRQWSDDKREPHSLFTVAGSTPMKGLHQLIGIVAILKNRYPDVKLYVPGAFSAALREMSGKITNEYEKYLYRLIKEHQLEQTVVFTGKLSAEQMADYMCRCALYVNPSCSEVHALSLREAMTVGTPCITTDCGSVTEFVKHAENGLIYRYAEPEVCEHYIVRLLEDPQERCRLSQGALRTWADHKTPSLSAVYRSVNI